MPRWLVMLAVAGLIFAVMTPAAVEAGTPLNAQYFANSGIIRVGVPATIDDSLIAAAVAAPDGKYIQMGPDSSITMMFPVDYYALPDGTSAPDLRIDILNAGFPAWAEVLLSPDGVNYWSEGFHVDTANIDLDVGDIVKYVMLVQPLICPDPYNVDEAGHCIDQEHSERGFDLDAVVALNSGEPEPTTSCPDGKYFVNSYGDLADTPIVKLPVDDGHFYDITASGWFYAGGWGTYGGTPYQDIRADAEFSETRYARVNAKGWTKTPGIADGDPYLDKGYAEEYFDLLVNFDGSLAPVDWVTTARTTRTRSVARPPQTSWSSSSESTKDTPTTT